ncbi:pro-adrenomedullin [Hoplias malabaricus]|uniref:pro-adrenomedullin n=1 Tax=Hoplias malabaricus TaxID=27720 RepID=UPI0034621E3A
MKMVLQKIVLYCALATFLPCVLSATLQLNPGGGDKLKVWLQSRLRRELCVPDSEEHSKEITFQESGGTDPVSHRHSIQNERVKRGCKLLTCAVHDLVHHLTRISERPNSAPDIKISAHGYGRRRRRSVPQPSAALTTGQGHVKLTWFQPQRQGSPKKRT